jgi:adenine-specific DNA-methyltransferase
VIVARIEDLVAEVGDARLRAALAAEVSAVKRRRKFGLVYETHIPEMVLLRDAPIRPGAVVADRRNLRSPRLQVVEIAGETLTGEPLMPASQDPGVAPNASPVELPIADALVEKRFGEPVYPTLRSVGEVRRAGDQRPAQVVINGENLFALELLAFLFPHDIDCIYIDPPFNTGARDWRYNNSFVDKNDAWRHSKWIAMMARRLRIAARLLRSDGVLVVAIDENEHASLVLLLGDIFPQCDLTSVAIVHNPRGIQGDNFSYTNEFAVFVVPRKQKVIAKRPKDNGRARPDPLRNWGGESMRTDAANCFYPVLVKDGGIVGFGDVAPDEFHPTGANEPRADGTIAVWPIGPEDGLEHKWRYARDTVEGILPILSVREVRGRLDIYMTKDVEPYRTVWTDPRYDSNKYGTQMVTDLTGGEQFNFPKSLYNVHDVLHAATSNRPNARILDFFAGSGTTLHATCLLNAEDGGSRQCILVTNNEVEEKLAHRLNRHGTYAGDPEFEKHGIFEAVTRPRTTAAIRGKRVDDTALDGEYLSGRPLAEGFPENLEFFRLGFLDPDDVMLGLRLRDLLPALWLGSGGIGQRCEIDEEAPFVAPAGVPYAFLLRASGLHDLQRVLDERLDITHVYVVTDSEDAYASLCQRLPARVRTTMLYADYLRAFSGEWGGEA